MTGRLITAAAAVLALLAGAATLRAGNPARGDGRARILAGIEWGYDATLLYAYHFNYLETTDGFRIDDRDTQTMLYSNAHACANVTLEFAGRFALGLHAGYAGVRQRTRLFPISLRSAYFFSRYDDDSQFVFLEGGAGLHENRSTVSPFGKAGYGYRFNLTRRASMDFSASLQCTYDHPPIYDASIPGYIPEENQLRSDALYGALVLAIGINF